MTDSIWTDTMDAKLLELWSAGKSKRDIGAHFGKTRCSIVGRMNRLRWRASRERGEPIPERPKPPRKRPARPTVKITSHAVKDIQDARAGLPKARLETLVTGKGMPIWELPLNDGCRYCTSDSSRTAVALFCGAPVVDFHRSPWCDEHRRIVWRERV